MSYANWLGESTVSLPNNTIVIGGVPVNVVPIVAGTTSNVNTWANVNFTTFWTASNVAAGTYLCGMETFTDPLVSSNAGAGWNQGDYFVARIIDKDGASTRAVQNFLRPYTAGVQVNATSPFNKGATDTEAVGILVLTSNTDIVWQGQFGKDSNSSYPRTVQLTIESPWYQRIA
jgi:hypothetical protein